MDRCRQEGQVPEELLHILNSPHTQYRMFLAHLQGMNEETNLTLLLSFSLSICMSFSLHTPLHISFLWAKDKWLTKEWWKSAASRFLSSSFSFTSAWLCHQGVCVSPGCLCATQVFVCFSGVCVSPRCLGVNQVFVCNWGVCVLLRCLCVTGGFVCYWRFCVLLRCLV